MGHTPGDGGGGVVRETDINDGGGILDDIGQETVFSNDLLNSVDGSKGTTHPPAPLDPLHIAGIWETQDGAPDVTAEDIPMNHAAGPGGQPFLDTCGHGWPDGSGSPNVFIHAILPKVEFKIEDKSVVLNDVPGVQNDPIIIQENYNDGIIKLPTGITELEAAITQYEEPKDDKGLAVFPSSSGGGAVQRSIDNGLDPNAPLPEPIEEIPPPEPKEVELVEECLPCDEPICPNYLDSCQLSPNFTLGMLSTKAAISSYKVRAQAGLTKDEIVCNLANLANVALEAILAQYPNMYVTSGFRHGSGRSKHHLGIAADLQFRGFDYDAYWAAVQWVRDNIEYDAIIYEYGRKPWIHLQFRCEGNRGIVQTRVSPGNYKKGLIRIK